MNTLSLRRLLLVVAVPLCWSPAAPPPPPATPVVPAPKPIVLAAEDQDWVRHEIYVREAERMDQEFPRLKKGDDLRLRLLNGSDLVGSFVFASSNNFTVVRNNVESRQWFRDLDPTDRLRLDPSFREAALKISAVSHTRRLIPADKTPPVPRPGLDWEELIRSGTAEEMFAFARNLLSTWSERNTGPLDPGHAYLLLSSLAPDKPDAAANLGGLLLNGVGVRKNPELSLQLLASAAAADSADASAFLGKFPLEHARRTQAQADGERWLAGRREEWKRYAPRILSMKKEREELRRATLGPEEPPPPPPPVKKKR